jgi:hypothetical protein
MIVGFKMADGPRLQARYRFLGPNLGPQRSPNVQIYHRVLQSEPFGAFFLLSLTKRLTKRLSTIVGKMHQTVRIVKTCGKFDIVPSWGPNETSVLAFEMILQHDYI